MTSRRWLLLFGAAVSRVCGMWAVSDGAETAPSRPLTHGYDRPRLSTPTWNSVCFCGNEDIARAGSVTALDRVGILGRSAAA